MLEEILQHIDRATLFGAWIAVPVVMLGVNLTVVFIPAFIDHPLVGGLGFMLGRAAFLVVLPAIRLLRVAPWLRRDAWKVGERSPAWSRLPLDRLGVASPP